MAVVNIDKKRLTTVGGVGITQLIAFGTSLYLLTVLSAAIVKETHWALGWVVGGYSLAVLVSATVTPIAGRYVGAGHGHVVLAISSLLFAAGLAVMGMAANLIVYAMAWCLIGLAMGCGLYDTAFGTVGRVFGASARASIIQIALLGGFASTVFWPLSSYLVGHVGWRGACFVFAGLHLIINLPIYALIVPRPEDATRPAEMKTQAAIQPGSQEKPIYLALGFVVSCEMAIVAMMSVHMQTILQSRGLTPAVAVGLSALVGPSQVLARLAELTIGRRWPPYVSMMLGVAAVCVGVALISLATGLNMAALMIYGAGLGVVSITTGTVPLAVFGPVRYPPLMGRIRRIGLVFQALTSGHGGVAVQHVRHGDAAGVYPDAGCAVFGSQPLSGKGQPRLPGE